MTLDPQTLQLMMFITSIAMVVALVTVAAGHRVAGLWSLAGSVLANAATFGLYFVSAHIPAALGTVISDGTIAFTFSLVLLAILRLRGQQVHPLWVWAPPVAMIVASTLLLQVRSVRSSATDAISVVQGLVALWALTRGGGIGIGRGRHILLVSLLAAVLLFAARSIGLVSGLIVMAPAPSTVTADTLSYLLAYLIMIFSTLGFVLATAEITADEHRQMALRDSLTGLPNRRAVLDALELQWTAALDAQRPLAVLMIDVDHFKLVNDHHGHAAGDAVLRRLAKLLRMRIRSQDTVGRFGGEEFLVVLPDTTPAVASTLADELRGKIASVPIRARNKMLPITVSVGLHGLWPGTTDTIADLIHTADGALYRAKAAGRNCVVSG